MQQKASGTYEILSKNEMEVEAVGCLNNIL